MFAGAIRDRGFVLPVNGGACYNCVFGEKNSEETCDSGVLVEATEKSGTMSAQEALTLMHGEALTQGMHSFSLNDSRTDVFAIEKKQNCKVCQGVFEKLESKEAFSIRYCARVGGLRADPLNAKATKQTEEVDGHKVIVGENGEVYFPKLKDADVAKTLVESLI